MLRPACFVVFAASLALGLTGWARSQDASKLDASTSDPAQCAELQKQIDDALKTIDNLDSSKTDEAPRPLPVNPFPNNPPPIDDGEFGRGIRIIEIDVNDFLSALNADLDDDIQLFRGFADLEGFPEFPLQLQQLQRHVIPNVELPRGFRGLPGGFPFAPLQHPGALRLPPNPVAAPNALDFNGGEATAVRITNDGYAIEHAAGALKIKIQGRHGAAASEIKIVDGAKTIDAQSVAEVPATYRATVTQLLEFVK